MATPGKGKTKVKTTSADTSDKKEQPQQPQADTKELVHQPQGSGALATTPEVDLAADAAEFQDHYERTSLQIPFLQILQSNSPQVDPGGPKFIKGAQMSMFFNTLTSECFDGVEKGVQVVPCYHYATVIEWRLREKGGGFIKDWGLVAGMAQLPKTHKDEKNRDVMPNNETHLVYTETYFVLFIRQDGSADQMMLTMTSTQLKKARNWNSRMSTKVIEVPGKGTVKAPMFFNSYMLKTISESNQKGKWYGYVILDAQPTLTISKEVYLAAREFRRMMQEGVAAGQVSFAGAETDGGEGHGDKEDTPF